MADTPRWYDVQPPVETPKERWERDLSVRGGDWNGANLTAGPNGILGWVANTQPAYVVGTDGQNWTELTLDARETDEGRNGREYNLRGGDRYDLSDADPDGTLAPKGRNEREYASPYSKKSAITGTVHPNLDGFQGNDTYVAADAPTGYEGN